ncbi:MAG: hypothetical protein EBT72_05635 [Flavobacteriia bacterium]|nr:hypothetical protein [Flavobacteriia bacterium]
MRKKIQSLIQDLAQQITEQSLTDDAQLHQQLQKIYELSVVLQHQNLSNTPAQQGQEQVIEQTLNAFDLDKRPGITPPEEQHNEVPPLMDTIKNLVDEMPEAASNQEEKQKENINDHYSKTLKIDLNDRLSFVQHLFDQNLKEYERVLQQISSMTSWEEADYMLEHLVKKEYNNWEGKEAVAARFVTIIKTFFSE